MRRLLGQPLPKCQACGQGFKRRMGVSLSTWLKQKYCDAKCAAKRHGEQLSARHARAAST